MTRLPSLRYVRNLILLLFTGAICMLALRLAYRAPIHLLWVVPLMYLAYLVWASFWFAHPLRMRFWSLSGPDFAGLSYEKVLFKSRDGLTLFGWYLPGQNRAAVILAHGLSGSGMAMAIYAVPLAHAGYNVLLIDLRAHGSSDGDTSTYGVLEAHDIAGAADYLLSRGDVDPDKIGVLGISLGAQAAVHGAAQSDAIRALALEGLGPADSQDFVGLSSRLNQSNRLAVLWYRIKLTIALFQQWMFNFFSGQRPTALTVEIGRIAPRPILLIACGKYEIHYNRRFCAAAPESCTLWELPKAPHAGAYGHDPLEYLKRILAFFDQALREQSHTSSG